MAVIYKVWYPGCKNPIHILYISCILQQPFLHIRDTSPCILRRQEERSSYVVRVPSYKFVSRKTLSFSSCSIPRYRFVIWNEEWLKTFISTTGCAPDFHAWYPKVFRREWQLMSVSK